MKYMLTGNYRAHVLMRVTLLSTLFLLSGFWLTNALLYFRNMDLRPVSVVQYYRGSEAEFSMPRTYGAMLEVTHMHLPMMAMVILLLTHLAIFLPWPLRLRLVLVLGTFGCALLGETASWLVRFAHPAFAWLKILSFLGLQAGLAVLLVGLAMHLLRTQARSTEDLLPIGGRTQR
ncbi:MAG TPA: hypothetical protein VFD07_14025 [Candidatus Krumholzibacteria bacterium]|nr:hypothetical protein [Candidatus Krumholzibacteria bacterium]